MKDSKWAYPVEMDAKRRLKKFYESSQMPQQWAKELAVKIHENFSFDKVAEQYTKALTAHINS